MIVLIILLQQTHHKISSSIPDFKHFRCFKTLKSNTFVECLLNHSNVSDTVKNRLDWIYINSDIYTDSLH